MTFEILLIPCSKFNFKVPKFVAEAWEASEDGAEVAKLTTSGGGKGGWKLKLDPSTTSGLADFVLKVLYAIPKYRASRIIRHPWGLTKVS